MARSQHSGLACSFCEKSRLEVHKLISGPTALICNECVDLCNAIFAKDDSEIPALVELGQMTLLDFLRQFVSGRAVDSITVSELRDAIAVEREKRLPKPAIAPDSDPMLTDPELEVPAVDLAVSDFTLKAVAVSERQPLGDAHAALLRDAEARIGRGERVRDTKESIK